MGIFSQGSSEYGFGFLLIGGCYISIDFGAHLKIRPKFVLPKQIPGIPFCLSYYDYLKLMPLRYCTPNSSLDSLHVWMLALSFKFLNFMYQFTVTKGYEIFFWDSDKLSLVALPSTVILFPQSKKAICFFENIFPLEISVDSHSFATLFNFHSSHSLVKINRSAAWFIEKQPQRKLFTLFMRFYPF